MTHDEAMSIVAEARDRWAAAFRARDFAAIVALYDENALFFGSAPDLSVDHAGIRAYFDDLPMGIALTSFPPQQVQAIAPGVIVASGFWTFSLDGETLEFRLSWTLVHRGETWRIAQHHAALKPKAGL